MSDVRVEGTALSRNALYKTVYSIALNTVFASLIPFLALLYFNVYTVLGECGQEPTS